MGISDKKNKNNLVQIKIKGKNQSSTKNKNNTVWVHKSQPIRYTLTELRQIKCKVDHNSGYKILGGHACYRQRNWGCTEDPQDGAYQIMKNKKRKESTQIKSYRNKNWEKFRPRYNK